MCGVLSGHPCTLQYLELVELQHIHGPTAHFPTPPAHLPTVIAGQTEQEVYAYRDGAFGQCLHRPCRLFHGMSPTHRPEGGDVETFHTQLDHDEGFAPQPGQIVQPFGRKAVGTGGENQPPYALHRKCFLKQRHHVAHRGIGVGTGLEIGQKGGVRMGGNLPSIEQFAGG